MADSLPAPGSDETSWINAARQSTPARVFSGPPGRTYSTAMQLALRGDHAAAVDAVWDELDLAVLGTIVETFGLFEVETCARSKSEFLLRPPLGRVLTEESRRRIVGQCPLRPDVQIVIGDGLSSAAVTAQVPSLLPALADEFARRGATLGRPFVVRHCRVGILNEIGPLLEPRVVVLLIGERPGLATAESLSAYLAYRPAPGDTDARRNLISNIHRRGTPTDQAAARIAALAAQLMAAQASGVAIKEATPLLISS